MPIPPDTPRAIAAVAALLLAASTTLVAAPPARAAEHAGAPRSWAGPPPAARRLAGEPPVYQPPVDDAVRDPFRPPATPYGPGNRGLEYDTVGGETARAIGPGVVAFAGRVAGRGVVSVVHPDGLRSSLTGLARITVRKGDRVVTGSVVGVAAPLLHLGVRRDGTYIDPASLFGRRVRPRHAILVRAGRGGPSGSVHRPPPAAAARLQDGGPRWGARAPAR